MKGLQRTLVMAGRVVRCDRCKDYARTVAQLKRGWNCTAKGGRVIGFLCPACQTPEENAEAEVKAATLNYVTGPDGLTRTSPE